MGKTMREKELGREEEEKGWDRGREIDRGKEGKGRELNVMELNG